MNLEDIFENSTTLTKVVEETYGSQSYEVDHIEAKDGIRLYVKGHVQPHKGYPSPEAIVAINTIKRLVKELLRSFIPRSPKKAIAAFNKIAYPVISSYILKWEFRTNTAQGLQVFFTQLLTPFVGTEAEQTAVILSHIFEYDSAYRFRLMDLLSETTKEQLLKNPRKELLRLFNINKERDYEELSTKIGTLRILTYLLFIPKIRKACRNAIEKTDITTLQFDEADRYWAAKKIDYKYFGLTIEERGIDMSIYL